MSKELAEKLLQCIDHEQQQDVEITSRLLKELPLSKLVSAGLAVNHLQLENVRTGLGGKVYLDLTPDPAIDNVISVGETSVGDIVKIYSSKSVGKKDEAAALEGVVFKSNDKQIVVSVDESKESDAFKLYEASKLYLVKTANSITYKRMQSTMRKLAEIEGTPNNSIIQYLLCQRQFVEQKDSIEISFHNQNLNDSQKKAIKFALQNEISIIHGPPGTGKTYTLVELIMQLVKQGQRILICGPSNISVDTILERLAKVIPGNLLLRFGHPARLLPSTLAHSIDVISKSGDAGSIIRDINQEINNHLLQIKKFKSYRDRKKAWQEIKDLRKELKQRERRVISELILAAKVVVCTLHGSSSGNLCRVYDFEPKLFNTLIIDEVSQSLEPQCWIPLISHYKSNISKLVIAGDNKQLPPTIKTEDDEKVKKILGTTIFDKLENHYGNDFKKLLNVQYRMNEQIMEFPSHQLYKDELIAAEAVAKITLADLPGVEVDDNTSVPLLWFDTQGDDFLEKSEEVNGVLDIASSKYNENEAYLLIHYVSQLLNSNVSQESIGIISPYNAQVSLLRKLVHEKYSLIEISSVDGFQGREKDCIILSLVRSNDLFEVGFLRDERRLNVAMTRAKRQLCVIGNMETLERSQVPFLKEWVRWSEENSEIRYPDLSDFL
ncbi:ATP-dependent 5'-3' DNA helicase HCS1 Ecym_3390 [Eremothecium cymbalariae DBVPG|uniref:DNA helicase n=1 Tax=Eremothecium cymbalariae (strain CBS 270.75 / DBVPG 7215 / KCTC 17166 / NRRL Y-17582) TaxID=931890 RepID=G8JRV8_ERECY|nr:Hypothetical protein Ecym_3390 [Eremothecium cymbalariae DBVPG\